MNEIGHAVLDAAKRTGGLHHGTEGDFACEVAWGGDDERKDHRDLVEPGGEGVEQLRAVHDLAEIGDHRGEAGLRGGALLRLSAVQGDAFEVLAHPGEAEPEIRFDPLLAEVQRSQRPPDQMGERGARGRVEQADPNHVARDVETEQPQRAGEGPEDGNETEQGDEAGKQAEGQAERFIGKIAEIVGDALIGVVGAVAAGIAGQGDAPVGPVRQPVAQQSLRHPAAPVDAQPLAQIGPVDRQQDEHRCQAAEAGHETRLVVAPK